MPKSEFEKLVESYVRQGLTRREAAFKAKLQLLRDKRSGRKPQELVYLGVSDWIPRQDGSEFRIWYFLDPESGAVKRVFGGRETSDFSLDPLDVVKIKLSGKDERNLNEVSAATAEVIGKEDIDILRKASIYKRLKELFEIPRGERVDVITEGQIIYPPKQTSTGSLRISLTDIFDEPPDIVTVFIPPEMQDEEFNMDDHVIVVGTFRKAQVNLMDTYTINPILIRKASPPEEVFEELEE